MCHASFDRAGWRGTWACERLREASRDADRVLPVSHGAEANRARLARTIGTKLVSPALGSASAGYNLRWPEGRCWIGECWPSGPLLGTEVGAKFVELWVLLRLGRLRELSGKGVSYGRYGKWAGASAALADDFPRSAVGFLCLGARRVDSGDAQIAGTDRGDESASGGSCGTEVRRSRAGGIQRPARDLTDGPDGVELVSRVALGYRFESGERPREYCGRRDVVQRRLCFERELDYGFGCEFERQFASAGGAAASPDGALTAELPAGTSVEEVRSAVKDVKVELIEDRARAYVVFDFHGKDMTLQLEGRLGAEGGYLRFDPVAGQLGALPIPQSTLESAVKRLMESPENREKLKLPEGMSGLKVENGEIVVSYK